jgi:hypothetical protein
MFDVFTGWKISVEPADHDGAYIIVPAQQVAALCCLLTEYCIPYEVEGAVPSPVVTPMRRPRRSFGWGPQSKWRAFKTSWTWHRRGVSAGCGRRGVCSPLASSPM